jgi:hypothetical protein
MNLKATADALAARYVGVTATNGTVTESLVTPPTASLPNALAKGPALFVFHPRGVLDIRVSRIRADELDFPVRLLRDPLNYPERSDWLYAWYDALRDKVRDGDTLGLAYVSWANVVATEVELDGGEYGGNVFDLIEFTVRVHFGDLQP